MPPVSTCIIAKDCQESLDKTLESLNDFVRSEDEVVIVNTGQTPLVNNTLKGSVRFVERPELCDPLMLDLARKWCPEESSKFLDYPQFKGGWLRSFAEARQVSFDEASNRICFWIDSDDTLVGGKDLRDGIDRFFDEGQSAIFLRYAYSHDSTDGRCTTELFRERVVDKEEWSWKGRCHEVLIPLDGLDAVAGRLVKTTVPEIYIRHEPEFQQGPGFSDLRNYTILRREVEECEEDPDPRTLYYLGNACRGLRRWGEAICYYEDMLGASGSSEDRLNAALAVAQIRFIQQRYWSMLEWGHECIKIKGDDARGYFTAARAYYHMQDWEQCIRWTEIGRQIGAPETLSSVDPNAFDFYPGYFAMEAYRELGDVPAAMAEGRQLLRIRPDLEVIEAHLQDLQHWAQKRKIGEAAKILTSSAKNRDCAIAMTQQMAHPEMLEDFGVGRLESEAHTDGRATLAILCGNTDEAWGPKSIETGIGGSERMAIEMAKRLSEKGLAVTIYANVPVEQRGVGPGGAVFKHYTELNTKIKRDYILAWRAPEMLELPIAARKRYLWLHDAILERRFNETKIALADKIIPLSQWHRNLYPSIPDGKIYVSRNGIDVKLFEKYKDSVRDPKKVLYTSSPDRGLVQAMNAFWLAKEQDPELTFDILYGFTPYWHKMAARQPYGYCVTQKRIRHWQEFAEDVFSAVEKTPGVNFIGRVPCEEVTQRMCEAGVWLYPAPFTEISCMSAMEAQAAGLVPVCSKVAALGETVDWEGLALEASPADQPKDIAASIIAASEVSEEARQESAKAALKRFNLDSLADEWMRDLFHL